MESPIDAEFIRRAGPRPPGRDAGKRATWDMMLGAWRQGALWALKKAVNLPNPEKATA